ncbi:MAG: class I SAM-dependent methyltransferase, partial [Candidatus Binatia bacterium]
MLKRKITNIHLPPPEFIETFLRYYYHIPPLALFRTVEARHLSKLEFTMPMLDLGCGDGFFSSVLFANRPGDIFACDLNALEIEKAKKRAFYREVRVADATTLPYSAKQFATVFSNCVLEHIPNLSQVLKEVSRILKKDGKFVFTVPSEHFVSYLYHYRRFQEHGKAEEAKRYAIQLNQRLQHYHYYTPREWEERLAEAGLRLESYGYYLSQETEAFWDRLTHIYIQKFLGCELHVYLFYLLKYLGLRH